MKQAASGGTPPLRFDDDTAYQTSGKWIHGNVVCVDGFTASIQASSGHYCRPREDGGPWSAVEVGFPSARPEPWSEFEKYAEDPETPTDTVYAYVPVTLIAALIKAHGGLR